MCTPIHRWHHPSPRVPSVLSGVGTQRGPTFWEWKKCATFRLLRRYELHFARAVAFSFCEQNGTPAGKMEKG